VVGLARLRLKHRRQSVRLRIGQADTPQSFRTPRPGRHPLEAFTSDAKERLRLTVSVVLRRLRLYRFADPATQPQGAFPHRQRAGCPRVALARVNQTTPLANPRQHIATVLIA
jgi:hypothetical protein